MDLSSMYTEQSYFIIVNSFIIFINLVAHIINFVIVNCVEHFFTLNT